MDDLADALRQRRQFLWRRGIDPVIVAWDEAPLRLKLRLPSPLAALEPRYRIALESGEVFEGKGLSDSRIKTIERSIEGVGYVTQWINLPEKLPLGYHSLHLQVGGRTFESYVLSSALQSHGAADAEVRRWGLFCPLYAFVSKKSWGTGSFSDLERLIDFTGKMGGDFVGTLPLLSAFLDEPFNPSPYAPVSRLFWNEFYLDVTRIPELQRSPVARAMIHSSLFQNELEHLRAAPLIEYRQLMALKRKVLEELLRTLMNRATKRRAAFERFIETHPQAQDYAAFRAKVERERASWDLLPAAHRDGRLAAGDYDATESSSIISMYNGKPKRRCMPRQKRRRLGGPLPRLSVGSQPRWVI
jgi:4-alpha-glucanotransferase